MKWDIILLEQIKPCQLSIGSEGNSRMGKECAACIQRKVKCAKQIMAPLPLN